MHPHAAVDSHAVDTAARLRAAGLRVTDSRRAVVEALVERPHASADELFGIVARTVPGTSLQSVYNALGDFVDAGLARRIEPAGRPGLFELRVDDNHHHLICSECGAVAGRRLRRGRGALPDAVRRARLRAAGGRGDLLGRVPRLCDGRGEHRRAGRRRALLTSCPTL